MLRSLSSLVLLAVTLLVPVALTAQGSAGSALRQAGPRILSGGMSFQVDDPSFVAPEGHVFRAVFEINAGDADGTQANNQINTIARFLNIHARHGVPDDRVHGAAVVHGGGWTALLTDEAYGARFDGKPNPTRALVEELVANGVPFVLCGQTAGGRGVTQEELIPGVQLGWSAMTALNVFQSQGYYLNPW